MRVLDTRPFRKRTRPREIHGVEGGRDPISRYRVEKILKVDLKEECILQMTVECNDVASASIMIKAGRELNIAIAKLYDLLAATVSVALRCE
jgi:hypothetical protein